MSDEIGFVLLLLFFANPIIVLKKSSRQPLLEFFVFLSTHFPHKKAIRGLSTKAVSWSLLCWPLGPVISFSWYDLT